MSSDQRQGVILFSAEAKMRLMKEEALEKGDLTDFSFLVGPTDQAQLLHCFKSDLFLASDYFRTLLRTPLTGPPPVCIKHVQPHIFKLILRFITFHTISELSTIEDALALTFAADEFLLDDLKLFCESEIERLLTFETVWTTLNELNMIPQIMAACSKVLSYDTKRCLAHPTFQEITQESLIFFLNLEMMNIYSERELVDACLSLADNLTEEAGEELMKAALPHLRVLALIPHDYLCILDFMKYLTDPENSYMSRVYSKEYIPDGPIPKSLNQISHCRKSPKVLHSRTNIFTILDVKLIEAESLLTSARESVGCDSSTLTLFTHHEVLLTDIGIFTKSKTYKDLDYKVSILGEVIAEGTFAGAFQSNLGFNFVFKNAIKIPKSVRFEIQVNSKEKLFCRELTKDETESIARSLNEETVFSHLYFKNSIDTCFQRQIVKCFLIKSLHYQATIEPYYRRYK